MRICLVSQEYPPETARGGIGSQTYNKAHALAALERGAVFDVVDVAEDGAEGFGYQINQRPWSRTPVVVQLHGPLAMFAERIGWPARDSEFLRVVEFMEDTSIRLADALMACSAN